MGLRIFLALLILLPVSALSAENSQNNDPGAEPALQSVDDEGTQPDPVRSEDLRQIESYKLQLDGEWNVKETSGDESTALIVNPFSIRKRSNFYGSVYEYHRNDNFDARNFFDPVGQPLPEFKRNQFGTSLGVEAEKLKLFGSYDGLRIVKGSTIISRVPTADMKQGIFDNVIYDPLTGAPFENNRIPDTRIHPVALKLLSLFPDPNRNDPQRNYVNNKPVVDNTNSGHARIDYEISPDTKVYGTYNISDRAREMVSTLPVFGSSSTERDQDLSIRATHSFSPNKVLSFGVSVDRSVSLMLSDQAFQEGLLASIGIEGVSVLDPMDEGYPQMDILGYASIGSSFGGMGGNSPETFNRNRYRVNSDFTYVHGNHNLSFGGDLDIVQLNNMQTWGTRRGQFGFSGMFTGDAFADFLLGNPYVATRGIGSDRADLRQKSWRLYMKDSWKIDSHVTLNMGLAYSYSPFFTSTHDNVSFFYPLVFEPPLDGEVIVTGSARARELGLNLNPGQAAYNDKNDWQPDFGIAYSPFGNNRLVFRASYSIRHSPMNTFQALTYMGRNYPFFYLQRTDSPQDIGNPFDSASLPALTFKAMDPNLRNSYMQDRALSLQYEFSGGWSLELNYEGRKTTRLFRVIPANVPLPAPAGQPLQPRRPNPNYGMFEILRSDASYSNNGMEARVTKRLTGFFSLQGNFSWNRAVSDSWSWTFANPNNPRDLAAERSLWGFRPTKSLNVNYILDLPVGEGKLLSSSWAGKLAPVFEGWRISGIVSMMGGRPFSPEVFGDPNNDGVWGDRPNRIGSGSLPDSERSIDQWFNTSDFETPNYAGPDPQWFGNSGRNVLMGPGSTQWDVSFLKRIRVTDSGNLLEFRVQLFNAFNHANFDSPDHFINSPTFGVISGADNAREIEIALKYSF